MPTQRCRGSQSLRHRLLLSHITGKTLRVDDIRVHSAAPGLRSHEACLLRLLEKVTNGTVVEINETGTRLRYTPGVVVGGDGLVHDCGTSRGVTYFLEPLAVLALFGKQPLRITLRGVTNCATDPSADSWQAASCALLRRVCGASGEGADAPSLTLLRRGLPSAGGGEVLLRVPALRSLSRLRLSDPGLVKRVRGVAFTERVTPQAANRLVDAARGLLNRLIPDVYIFTDHRSGAGAGAAPGFGLSLFAETTTGCVLAADGVADAPPPSARGGGGGGDAEAGGDAAAPWRGEGLAGGTADTPEGLGLRVAAALLAEVRRGGCVDAGHDAIALLLALAGPEQVATLRLGRLGGAAVRALRDARGFAGATFALEARRGAEEDSGGGDTVLCSCVGLGRPNTGRAVA